MADNSFIIDLLFLRATQLEQKQTLLSVNVNARNYHVYPEKTRTRFKYEIDVIKDCFKSYNTFFHELNVWLEKAQSDEIFRKNFARTLKFLLNDLTYYEVVPEDEFDLKDGIAYISKILDRYAELDIGFKILKKEYDAIVRSENNTGNTGNPYLIEI